MKGFIITLLFFAVILSETNGGPFLFLPEHMLPSIGSTFNLTFEGLLDTQRVFGIYFVQPVTDAEMKTIIGYRNLQTYTGDYTGIFYGVSYLNGTYSQALINPDTQECENVFAEVVNCTNWSSIMNTTWDNECSIVRIDSSITGNMSLTLKAPLSDLNRPVTFVGTTSISGSPINMTFAYIFLSKVEQKNFPFIKCYF
jgi:hypothetical protein